MYGSDSILVRLGKLEANVSLIMDALFDEDEGLVKKVGKLEATVKSLCHMVKKWDTRLWSLFGGILVGVVLTIINLLIVVH